MQTGPTQIGRHIRDAKRLSQIAKVFAGHGLWIFLEKVGISKWLTPDKLQEVEQLKERATTHVEGLPVRLRKSFEELGPAFIKLGQMLAVREDLLSKHYTEEFSKLQKDVTPLPFSSVRKVLETELTPEKLARIKTIEEQSIAAGSIAQVHRAELETGEVIALKIQRPGIQPLIAADLSLMEMAAGLFEKYIPELSLLNPTRTIKELKRAVLGELDFVREGGNSEKISRNFEDNDKVKIPDVFWEFTTEKVLALEFLDGVTVGNKEDIEANDLDLNEIVTTSLESFMQMVFIDGEYHGDLHAGNILALKAGGVGFLDFGITARISYKTRRNLANLLISVVEQDYDRMTETFIEITKPSIEFDLDSFQGDLIDAVAPYIGLRLSQVQSGKVLWEFAKVAAAYQVPLPQELILFLKTIASFEGVGLKLDPDFDILGTCETFAAGITGKYYSKEQLTRRSMIALSDIADILRQAPYLTRRAMHSVNEGAFVLRTENESMKSMTSAVRQASARMGVSLIIGSLIIGSSILAFAAKEFSNMKLLGASGFVFAGVLGVYIVISLLRDPK